MKELVKLIGKQGELDAYPLTYEVEIIDVKSVYGNDRLQVTPVSGSGTVWVNADRVKVGA
jgi:hypothetical protein